MERRDGVSGKARSASIEKFSADVMIGEESALGIDDSSSNKTIIPCFIIED